MYVVRRVSGFVVCAMLLGGCGSDTISGPKVATISVSLDQATISTGQTAVASATLADANGAPVSALVTWTSSATSVATVSSIGVVTAVAPGTAQISASAGGATGSATITVQVPVATISVSLASAQILISATSQATATLKDAAGATLSGRTVAWSSATQSVATVDNSGLVTAVSAGTSVISASSGGITGTATVTVIPNAPGTFTLSLPATRTANASTTPAFSWSSASGATSYKIEVATATTFGSSDVINQTVTTNSFTPTTALAQGTVYFWTVTAINSGGSTTVGNGPFELSVPFSIGRSPTGIGITPDGTKLLVAGSDTVTIFSLTTRQATAFVALSVSVGQIAVRSDGLQAVVAAGGAKVEVLDFTNNTASTLQMPCSASTLYDIAYTPGGSSIVLPDLAAACNSEGMRTVTVASGATTFADFASSAVGQGIAVMPNGVSALVTTGGSGSIKRVSLSSNAVTTISGNTPLGIAVLPDNSAAIFADAGAGTVNRLDLTTNAVSTIATASSNSSPHNLALTPDGTKAVVVGSFNVTVIQLSTGAILANYSAGGASVAISPDGKYAYVSGGSGSGASANVLVVRIP